MAEVSFLHKKISTVFAHATTKILQSLGPSVQTAVLYHLEKIQGVPSDRILRSPTEFAIALEKIFSTGSHIIEDKIIECMCQELGVNSGTLYGSFEQKMSQIYGVEEAKMTSGAYKIGSLSQTMKYNS